MSRAYYDPADRRIYGAFNYPGVLSHVGAISTAPDAADQIEKFADIKGPSIYTVTALAYDPDAHTIFYTADNNAYRDLMSPRHGDAPDANADEGCGSATSRSNRADRSLWGVRHSERHLLARIAAYRDWERIVSLALRHGRLRPDVSPDGTQIVASFG